MGFISKKQIYAIAGAVALSSLLYFAPTKGVKDNKEEEKVKPLQLPFSFEVQLSDVKKSLSAENLAEINKLEGRLSEHSEIKNVLLDSLGKKWDDLKQPLIAAHYFEQIAIDQSGEKNWLNAAYRYFDAFKMVQDTALRAALVNKAVSCYTKVIEINPGNLDAKTDLGVCYTETPQPMKGIMLLREVVKEKPGHENAQLNLGLLSLKSKQFDKAVDRFEKVLTINPQNIDIYLYLGETYLQKGDKEKAVKAFEKYKSLSKDASAIQEVDRYLVKIKNN